MGELGGGVCGGELGGVGVGWVENLHLFMYLFYF